MARSPQWLGKINDVLKRFTKGGGGTPLDPIMAVSPQIHEGVLTPAVYVMICDGQRQDQEMMQLFIILLTSPIFEGMDPDAFFTMVQDIEKKIGSVNSESAKEAVATAVRPLSPALKETAYAHAIRMIYADKSVHAAEAHALNVLEQWIGVKPQVAQQIKQSMAIMSRPANA